MMVLLLIEWRTTESWWFYWPLMGWKTELRFTRLEPSGFSACSARNAENTRSAVDGEARARTSREALGQLRLRKVLRVQALQSHRQVTDTKAMESRCSPTPLTLKTKSPDLGTIRSCIPITRCLWMCRGSRYTRASLSLAGRSDDDTKLPRRRGRLGRRSQLSWYTLDATWLAAGFRLGWTGEAVS